METQEKKKGKGKIILIAALAILVITGIGLGVHFIRQSVNYIVTENARIHTTLFHITPSMPGMLERFTIQEGQHVRENEVLGWLEGGGSFRSPVDGMVVRTFAERNQAVMPGEPVAVVADTANLHVQANIEETYIASVQEGQAVIVTVDAFGRRQFAGYVAEIGRVTDAAITGQMMSFTTGGTFTKVTQLLPVRINIIDDVDLSGLIGLNVRVRIRLHGDLVPADSRREASPAISANTITARGIVESASRRNVYSTLGHMIRRVYAEAGDRVTEGQVLGILDSEDLMLTVMHQQAESALRSARVELETRRVTHESLTLLYDAGSVSRLELRQSEDALTHAQNIYNDARVMLNSALLTLERQLIRSPMDGTVTAVFAREGAVGMGLLFVVEDTDNLRVRARFREYDIGRLRTGMSVTISSYATGGEYTGVVSRIHPAAVKNEWGETAFFPVVEFEAETAVTSADTDLRIGMTARLSIALD